MRSYYVTLARYTGAGQQKHNIWFYVERKLSKETFQHLKTTDFYKQHVVVVG